MDTLVIDNSYSYGRNTMAINEIQFRMRFDQLLAKLKNQGYRATPQRVALLRILVLTDSHPSAAQLYDQLREHFPTTSLATVYKTLNLLKDLDEVLELGFSDDDNRYDGSRQYAHPHLVCIRCRRIADALIEGADSLVEEVAKRSGYQVVGHRLDFFGLCPECRDCASEMTDGATVLCNQANHEQFRNIPHEGIIKDEGVNRQGDASVVTTSPTR